MAESGSGEIEPVYLALDDILELYGLIIGSTTTVAADHLRNRDGLEGALARPITYAHYENADLALQAAVLAHGIAEGQLFIDGANAPRLSRCSPSWRSTAGASRLRTPSWPTGYSASVQAPPQRMSQGSCAAEREAGHA